MVNSRKRTIDKVLSVVLALIMCMSVIPMTAFAGTATKESVFTFTVKDKEKAAVSEAAISYEISVNDVQSATGSVSTDESGEAAVDDVSTFVSDIGDESKAVKISYSVTKDGYEENKGSVDISDVNSNVDIELSPVEEQKSTTVTVSVADGITNGTVFLNGDKTSVEVEKGETVSVTVTPAKGYQIADVNFGDVTNVAGFMANLTVEDALEISATFVKVYAVTVNYSSESGSVKVNDDDVSDKGTVIIKDGNDFSLEAIPAENYRVSNVKLNGEDITFDNKGENDATYATGTITPEKDYEYVIEFALNRYSIDVTDVQNGTVTIKDGATTVEHNGEYEVSITPAAGYLVKSFCINSEPVDLTLEDDGNAFKATVQNVTEAQVVTAVFEVSPSASMSDVTWNFGDAVRSYSIGTNDYYVFKPGTNVVFKTETRNGIRINEDSSTLKAYRTPAWPEITKDMVIKQIEVFYALAWHDVEMSGKKIELKFDSDKPECAFSKDTKYFYNTDAKIKVEAKDELSGLDCIKYTVEAENVDKVEETVDKNGTTGDADISIELPVAKYNNKMVKISVIAVDEADNATKTISKEVFISEDVPELTVSVGGKKLQEASDDPIYSTESRTATIRIANNADVLYDEDFLLSAIEIKKDGVEVSKDAVSLALTDLRKVVDAENTYEVDLKFIGDGEYEWSLGQYVNKAGTGAEIVKDDAYYTVDEASEDVFSFIIDKTPPTAKISAVNRIWDTLLSKLTFGLWTNDKVVVTAEGTDTNGIKEENGIAYYKVDNPEEILSFDNLNALYADGEFSTEKIEVEEDSDFLVYARVVDNAGNYVFISTDGIIFDGNKGEISPVGENEDIITSELVNEFYNNDINFKFNVSEHVSEVDAGKKVYSGLSKIWYVVQKDCTIDRETGIASGEKTCEETLWSFDKEKPTKDDLVTSVKDCNFTVNAKDNNSDFVNVTIYAQDNAGNVWSWSSTFRVNTNTPDLSLSFNEDEVPSNNDSRYYKTTEGKRTATITISEDRASAFNGEINDTDNNIVFNTDDKPEVGIWINAADSQNQKVDLELGKDIIFSGFNNNNENPDVYTATIKFVADANYEWGIAYTNKAEHEATIIAKEDTHPFKFVSDSTPPKGTVKVKKTTWETLLSVITFGIYDKEEFEYSATAKDATSEAPKIYYYISHDPSAKTTVDLDALFKDGEFDLYESSGEIADVDQRFVVFTRVEDAAGNYQYLCSDGHIIDNSAPSVELTLLPGNRVAYDSESHTCATYVDDAVEKVDNKNETLYGIFNGDVTLDIKAVDPDAEDDSYSGIQSVSYWIECNGQKTKEETSLYNFTYENTLDNPGPEWDKLLKTFDTTNNAYSDKKIVVSKNNNSNTTVVYVTAVDNAGNATTEKVNLDIDVTAPTIHVDYDNKANPGAKEGYFTSRTATVTITERDDHFDADAATAGIEITAVDAKGVPVEDAFNRETVKWESKINEENPDLTTHKAVIEFIKDANYKLSISYTDKANNAAEGYSADFCVDKTAPIGTVKAVSAEGRDTTWENLKEGDITFGFWSNKNITVTETHDDATSEIASVKYYKVKSENAKDGTTALTAEDLNKLDSGKWTDFDKLTVEENEQFVVYLKITDYAGNYTYLSTNGLIVDDKHPIEESIAPEITINPQQPVNGIYNKDVKVSIKVIDPLNGGTYSGLKEVNYKVFDYAVSKTVPTQSGNLLTFDVAEPTQAQLKQVFSGEITVESAKNNSNDIRIFIYATDNAGNSSDAYTSIKIDTTAPAINVSYNNNNADSATYFKADRTATVKITERNFNPDDVKITITNTDGVMPSIGAWKDINGSGNYDNSTHTAKITYADDGDYTFKIEYTDLAGNKYEKVVYAQGTVAAEKFTIDKTLPVVNVSYDNNSAQNGKYFKAYRTATVVINEHNFDVSRVNFTRNASLNGARVNLPSVSWNDNGDTHIATIRYAADGDYTFDISVNDMAGNTSKKANYGSSVAGTEFTVDTTINDPDISGIKNGSAYKGNVVPAVSFKDVNYASYEIKLTKTERSGKGIDVTSKMITRVGTGAQGGSGSFNTFKKLPKNDGIYTLSVKMTDKAGNESSKSATFTVNRFGSVYEYGEYLCDLIKAGGQFIKKNLEIGAAIINNLVITEYNADKIVSDSMKILITRDGEPIDTDYSSRPVSSSGWYEYQYIINKDNFKEDGVYKISVSSDDATGNSSTSVPENSVDASGTNVVDVMTFTVDTQSPEIRNIINLDKSIASKKDIVDGKLNVKYTLVDVGGLSKVEVYVNDEIVDTVTEFENNYNFTGDFDVLENSDVQNVRLVVTDLAGNVTDTDAADFNPGELYVFNNEVTVSTNIFIRWYANKPLFFGSIGGVVVIALAVWLIVAKSKKKKESK